MELLVAGIGFFMECAGGVMGAVLWTSGVAVKIVRVSLRRSS